MDLTEKEEIVDDDYICKYLELTAKKSEQTKQLGVLDNKVRKMRGNIEKHFKLGESETDNYDVIIKESHGTRIAPKDRVKEILITNLGDEEANLVYHRLTVDTHRVLTTITNRLD